MLAVIGVVGLGLAALYFLRSFLGGSKKSKSTPKSESDGKLADDSCLFRGFSQKALAGMQGNPDVIVVGSGIGGLACAAVLAKSGKKVLVLEQHDHAGGCTHVFTETVKDKTTGKERVYEFDTGLHYVGMMEKWMSSRKMFDYVTDNKLEWHKMADVFELAVNLTTGQKVGMHSDVPSTKAEILKHFPNEAEAIDKYFKLLAQVDKAIGKHFALTLFFPRVLQRLLLSGTDHTDFLHRVFSPLAVLLDGQYQRYGNTTTLSALQNITSNSDLIGVLTYLWGDVGLPPGESSLILHTMVARHYRKGGYYPVGGCAQIAARIVNVIESHGGLVLVRAPVSQFIIDSSGSSATVRGVRVKGVDVFAPCVVSAIGAINTFGSLLPEPKDGEKDYRQNLLGFRALQSKDVGPSCALLSVFVGLRGSQAELQLPRHNIWCFPSWNHQENSDNHKAGKTNACAYFLSFPSAKDPKWDERFGDSSVALVILPVYYPQFKQWESNRVKHRGDDYNKLKDHFAKEGVDLLCKMVPSVKDVIDFVEVGTPVTNNYYLGSKEGECYGVTGPTRWSKQMGWMTPKTEISGLYLCGQDSLSPGVAGALASAMFAAVAVSPKVLKDIGSVL